MVDRNILQGDKVISEERFIGKNLNLDPDLFYSYAYLLIALLKTLYKIR